MEKNIIIRLNSIIRKMWVTVKKGEYGGKYKEKTVDGPETMIALSAVARNSGPIALILLWFPQNHIQWGVVRPPSEHHSGPL